MTTLAEKHDQDGTPNGNVCLSVSPNILPFLSEEERNANILLLDFEADREDESTLRLDLNVVFNPVAIRRGTITRVDYHVGTTGAEITLEARDGSISGYTPPVALTVKYSNSTTLKRKAALKLTPSVKSKGGKKELEVNLGSIDLDSAAERVYAAEFASEERYLATVFTGDAIKWTIALPRGEKVIRDFLIGNLYLFAKCGWAQPPRAGRVVLRTTDFRFFDEHRKPLSAIRSLLMHFALWRKGIRFENKDGFQMDFEEVENGSVQ